MGLRNGQELQDGLGAKVPKSCIPCSLICIIILLGLGATALLMLPQGAMASSLGSQMTSNNRITSLFVMFFLLRLIGHFGYLSVDMSCSKGILAVCVNVPFSFPWTISLPELRPLISLFRPMCLLDRACDQTTSFWPLTTAAPVFLVPSQTKLSVKLTNKGPALRSSQLP